MNDSSGRIRNIIQAFEKYPAGGLSARGRELIRIRWYQERADNIAGDPEGRRPVSECDRCHDPITGTPVVDPDDLMDRKYCREECLDSAAEESRGAFR